MWRLITLSNCKEKKLKKSKLFFNITLKNTIKWINLLKLHNSENSKAIFSICTNNSFLFQNPKNYLLFPNGKDYLNSFQNVCSTFLIDL